MPTNTGYISTLAQNPANHLIDNTDAVHSGIVKSLNLMAKGSYIAWGFNITLGGGGATATTYTCSNGGFFRDGEYVAYTSEGAIHNANIVQSPNNDWYAMLVIDSANGVKVRGTNALGSTTIKGADPQAGDIPIAMIRIQTGSNNKSTTREVQYLTAKSLKKSYSVGYESGSAYVQAMNIVSSATENLFESHVAESDFIFKFEDTHANSVFKVVDSANQVQFSVNAAGSAAIDQALTLGSTLSTTGIILSSAYTIQSPNTMIFHINSGDAGATAFYWRDSSTPTNIMSLTSAGELETLSKITTKSNTIEGLSSAGQNGAIFNQATHTGTLSLGNYFGTITAGNQATGIFSVGILKAMANSIQNATGNASITFGGNTDTRINNILVTSGGIANSKQYNTSPVFAANDAGNNAHTSFIGVSSSPAFIRGTMAAALANPMNLHIDNAEVIFIGFDEATHTYGGTNPQSTTIAHANAAAAGANPELVLMLADEENKASIQTFGGLQGFIALPDPTNYTGRRVTLRNNSQYACYVVVSSILDPSLALDNSFDGGITSVSQHGTGIYHSNSIVDITRVHTHNGNPAVYGTLASNGKSKNAILLKPNCSVELLGYQLVGDQPLPIAISAEQGNAATSQWYVIGQSGTQVTQPVNMTEGTKTEDMYLPVAYSGTMFFSSQNKKWYLPDHPPIGTTYTIASVANSATVYASNDATHQIVSVWGNTDGTKDSLYLGDTTAITSTTVTATNAKTFIYTTDRVWQVIG